MARKYQNGAYTARILSAELGNTKNDKPCLNLSVQLLERTDPQGIKIAVDGNAVVDIFMSLSQASIDAGVVTEQLAVLDPDDWLTAVETGSLINKIVPVFCSVNTNDKGEEFDRFNISTPRTNRSPIAKPATETDKIKLRAMFGLKPKATTPAPEAVADF